MSNMTPLYTQAHCQPNNIFNLNDMMHYLNLIESHLKTTPTNSSECHYSYSSNNDTFFKYVGSTLAKPMIRTLIYGAIDDDNTTADTEDLRIRQRSEKVKFDERIREERMLLKFERMSDFVLNELKPALFELDTDLRDAFVPNLINKIDAVQLMATEVQSGKKIEGQMMLIFPRLASGKYYQGKLDVLVDDLFPDLIEGYALASRSVTERDAIQRLIQIDLVNHKVCQDDEFHKRRIRAAQKCLDIFYPIHQELVSEDSSKECSIASGKLAEESCLQYIQSTLNDKRCTVLGNVFINTRRNYLKNNVGMKPKYRPPRRRNKSAVIWTDVGGLDRYRVCSEFDVLLLQESNGDALDYIESIWEVKRTISPSTLYDVLTKKLEAVELLLEDDTAELSYTVDNESKSIPFLPRDTSITFGMYGMELLPPKNAADSIRSVAGANVVSSSLVEVIRAIERCIENENELLVVEVDMKRTLRIVTKLRNLIEKKSEKDGQIRILMCVESEVDFLPKR